MQHSHHLVGKKKGSHFKIHVITMSKQDAYDLSARLNTSGVKSIWLTSELSQPQKSKLLELWEDGQDQVLVSTFTDGIDNSTTEDVIIVGATYSIYSLVQAIGRIRPNRQSFNKASIFIFHSSGYIRTDEQSINDNLSVAIGANIFPSLEMDAAKKHYKKMFHLSGYEKWIHQKKGYRQVLYQHFDIKSPICKHCSNCRQHNVIMTSAIQVTRIMTQEESHKKIVYEAVHIMLSQCLICCSNDLMESNAFHKIRTGASVVMW